MIQGAVSKARAPRHGLSDEQWELIEDLFPTNNFKQVGDLEIVAPTESAASSSS